MPDYKELFPKSFKARDFRNAPRVLTIASVEPRALVQKDDSVRTKLCVRFEETSDFWLAGPKEACPSIAEAIGSTNTDDWIGEKIELFEDETDFGDDRTDCVRARKASANANGRRKPRKARASKASKDEGWPRHVGDDDAGNALVQTEEGGEIYELHPDDLKAALSGELELG